MQIFLKAARFYKTYGFSKTVNEVFDRIILSFILDHFRVLFCAELGDQLVIQQAPPVSGLVVRCYKRMDDIPADVHDELLKNGSIYNRQSIYHKEILCEFLQRYFSQKGYMWVAFIESRAVGYLWSMSGDTIKRYHKIPLTKNDYVLAAAEVFPLYRGKGINPYLTEVVLSYLQKNNAERIFTYVECINRTSLRSFSKTRLQKRGTFFSAKLFGEEKIIWLRKSTHHQFDNA